MPDKTISREGLGTRGHAWFLPDQNNTFVIRWPCSYCHCEIYKLSQGAPEQLSVLARGCCASSLWLDEVNCG